MAGKNKEKTDNEFKSRPPVVVILGHVDHGKTSLLDYIKKTKVVEKESGGITQHIGAYQIEAPLKEAPKSRADEESRGIPLRQMATQDDFAPVGRKITFLDTPGHEAFSAMRSRGAKVADIAVLVVAADDGVKPQTKEAINHIKKAGLPVIVAINKIDKQGVLPEKVKTQLAEYGINVESYGGEVPSVNVSAKTGQGIDDLLDLILLVAEMEDLKSDSTKPASGVVIEAFQDATRGPTATLLVQEGLLENKNIILTESTCGTIKKIEDWRGNQTEEAFVSQPVVIIGLEKVPMVGEKWQVSEDLEDARRKAKQKGAQEQKKRTQAEVLDIGPDKKVLNVILKADVIGSLEAIRESLQSIQSEEVILRILKAEVGDIGEADIKLAESANALIIGFRVKSSNFCRQLAEQKDVPISFFEVIYELIQKIREGMSGLLEPEIVRTNLAKLKVIAMFKPIKSGQLFGAKVMSGRVERGLWVDVFRDEEKIGRGKILHLQHEKEEVENIATGKNAGILFKADFKVELNDVLEAYREEKRKRTL
jgi:translation initiation factor IF-2